QTYRLLLSMVAVVVLFAVFGRHYEYAEGPAAVLADGQLDVTARLSSTVTDVMVEPGERVRHGQVLARFFSEQQATQVEAFRREIDTLMLDRLRNPSDQGAEAALAALQAGYDMASAELDRLTVRAPRDGRVGDLRIRPGQLVQAGEVLLSMTDSEAPLTLLTLLPGRYRPQLSPGMPLRMQIAGYPYDYQHMTIESVGENVLAPGEARRLLAPAIAGSLEIQGPVVFVRARLSSTFTSDGHTYRFHDGMLGTAEARIRSERLIFTLIPGLRAVLARRPTPETTARAMGSPP
ncbi:MAG: HlyD family efflux transporter periplasmic adaptor subunit, partial [Acidobacteriota bacterium]